MSSTPLLSEDIPKNDVEFLPDDPENPLQWSNGRKWGIATLLFFTAFTTTFTFMSVVPIAQQITSELSPSSSSTSAVLLVTIWELGEAAGPLLIAPLSEKYGRYPIMNTCNVLFIIAAGLTATANDITFLITMRVVTGTVVSSNVLNPAVVGDIFPVETRGSAMSFVTLAPLFAGSLGPGISGALAERLGWRAVIWIPVAFACVFEVFFFSFFRETYKVVILRQRASKRVEEKSGLLTGMRKPFQLLVASPALGAIAIFNGTLFSYFYIVTTTLTDIMKTNYGYSSAAAGSAFIANGMGSLLGIAICHRSLDRIYIKLRASNNGTGHPEYRLPLAIIGGIVAPCAATMYGWCADLKMPVPLLLCSVVIMRAAIMLVMLPVTSYVVDSAGLFAASAMTGTIVTRCLAGGLLPLGLASVIEVVGYGKAFTMFGFITLSLCVIPIALFRHQPARRSKIQDDVAS